MFSSAGQTSSQINRVKDDIFFFLQMSLSSSFFLQIQYQQTIIMITIPAVIKFYFANIYCVTARHSAVYLITTNYCYEKKLEAFSAYRNGVSER